MDPTRFEPGYWKALYEADTGRPLPPQPPYWATVREIAARTPDLTGRDVELADLLGVAAWAPGYRWLVGGQWTGKTALLAHTVQRLIDAHRSIAAPGAAAPAGAPATTAEVDVIAYFLSRRSGRADTQRFVGAVIPQLVHLLDDPLLDLSIPEGPTGTDRFRDLWQRADARAQARDRRLLLVVDGLDEDSRPPGMDSVAAVLPIQIGPRSHVLVASRPHPDLPSDVPDTHPLRQTTSVELTQFTGAARLEHLALDELDALIGDHRAVMSALTQPRRTWLSTSSVP